MKTQYGLMLSGGEFATAIAALRRDGCLGSKALARKLASVQATRRKYGGPLLEALGNWIRDRGAFGATSEEVAEAFAIGTNSRSARLHELAMAGVIIDTGLKRKTQQGSQAKVYIHHSRWEQTNNDSKKNQTDTEGGQAQAEEDGTESDCAASACG